MYHKAPKQAFKLMKFDSYTRFVRSQLYQSCMLANVEGRPLPDLGPCSKSTATRKTAGTDSASLSDRHKADQKPQKKPKVKPGKSLPLDVYEGAEKKMKALQNKLTRDKLQEKRCWWGEELADHAAGLQSSARPGGGGSLLDAVEQLERERWRAGQAENCCVFLPDGTASLAPARAGHSIHTMLTGLYDKKGFPLLDVIIYLQGKDKLSLSQSWLLHAGQGQVEPQSELAPTCRARTSRASVRVGSYMQGKDKLSLSQSWLLHAGQGQVEPQSELAPTCRARTS
nr:regulator of G-protein signaling 14-like isoform X1 [Oncorhynchus nerka]XP_029544931.1 regulator of G-protein signaling 14-like isoform X1 [Oncorhynchus nerka]